MMKHDLPIFLNDRVSVAELKGQYPEALNALGSTYIDEVGGQKFIKFCGLVQAESGAAFVFRPRNLAGGIGSAKLTMQTLARFGREHLNREFEGHGLIGNSSQLAVIAELAADFLLNGIFAERQRVRSRNFGKVDWQRTISRVDAIYDPEVGPIYSEFLTVRGVASHETVLAKVQYAVLKEIFSRHAWWLPEAANRFRDTAALAMPYTDRTIWIARLRGAMTGLYSDHAIHLAKLLIEYLGGQSASAKGSYIFGVQDFHTVWELMLSKTLNNVEDGWNKRLPRAVYRVRHGAPIDAPTRSMRTDIILRGPTGLNIIDAKYYGGQNASSIPGWSDIAKQMLYEQSLRSVVGDEELIGNFFAFPADASSLKAFERVEMHGREQERHLDGFPIIDIVYLSIRQIMQSYIGGYRRDFCEVAAIPSGHEFLRRSS
jgi:hypothetical protein